MFLHLTIVLFNVARFALQLFLVLMHCHLTSPLVEFVCLANLYFPMVIIGFPLSDVSNLGTEKIIIN